MDLNQEKADLLKRINKLDDELQALADRIQAAHEAEQTARKDVRKLHQLFDEIMELIREGKHG